MIALLTDFGPDNHYVAQMKAKILRENRNAILVDITHSIAPQNIVEAAFILRDSVDAFPADSIFVVVVDPGVGTDRGILVVECNQQVFVLPDNGLIDIVDRRLGIQKVFGVDADKFSASSTFHGRDIMAPIAAKISNGEQPGSLAIELPVENIVKLSLEDPVQHQLENGGRKISGHVAYADCFGNLITDIESSWLPPNRKCCRVFVGDETLAGIHETFSDAESGQMLAIVGSHNRLEVAVNCGNAKQSVNCDLPLRVEVVWED